MKRCDRHFTAFCTDCFHVYGDRTEAGARATVARLRKRGIEASMHEAYGRWYVVTPKEAQQ